MSPRFDSGFAVMGSEASGDVTDRKDRTGPDGDRDEELQSKGFLRRQYNKKGIVKMAVLAAVTLAVLASLVFRVDAQQVAETLGKANPALLAAALGLGLLSPVAGSLRWFLLLRASGERIEFLTCVKVFYAALPANVLTPSKAGDLLRGVFLKDRVELWKGMGIILTERVVDVSVLASLALAGCMITDLSTVALAAVGVLAIAAGVFIAATLNIKLPLPEKFARKFEQLFAGVRSLVKKPQWLLAVASGSALTWSINLTVTMLCFWAFGAPVGFIRVAATMPIAIFVGLVPVTLSGMGTRDSAVVYLFADAAPQAASVGVGLMYSLILYWALAVVGLPFLRTVLRGRGRSPG